MNITEQDLDRWEEDIKRQERLLDQHGWKQITKPETNQWSGEIYDALYWEDPFGKIHPYQNGYDQLTLVLLRERGWKSVIETRHCGKKEWNKVDKWGRYQSPVTKRIYTFLDAQFIMEQGWDEQYCPLELCCGSTRMLNELVGENFDGDAIETWLHRNEKDELVLQWWNG